eukprot:15584-Heterococcus_DN1.PRE.2
MVQCCARAAKRISCAKKQKGCHYCQLQVGGLGLNNEQQDTGTCAAYSYSAKWRDCVKSGSLVILRAT